MDLGQVAVKDDSPRELELRRVAVAVRGQIAVYQVIRKSATDGRPILVERRHGHQIRDIDLLDELLGLVQQHADLRQPLGVYRVGLVDVQRTRHSADEIVGVRVFAAENRMDLDDFLLPFQGLDVMGRGQQVHFRRQLVGPVAPVAVGENAELAAFDERGKPSLHVGEVLRRSLGPVGDAAGNF